MIDSPGMAQFPIPEILRRISVIRIFRNVAVVAVEGPSGAGKSTLARELVEAGDQTALIPGDDFYRVATDDERRAWTAEEGARKYFDWERLELEVLGPLSRTGRCRYQRYDWASGKLSEPVQLPNAHVVLIEGVYSFRPELRRYYDFRSWSTRRKPNAFAGGKSAAIPKSRSNAGTHPKSSTSRRRAPKMQPRWSSRGLPRKWIPFGTSSSARASPGSPPRRSLRDETTTSSLEADREIGGYCKTIKKDGFVWDYSGHFFHFKHPEIEAWLRERMPGQERARRSRSARSSRTPGGSIDFPFQKNIHQLPQARVHRLPARSLLRRAPASAGSTR